MTLSTLMQKGGLARFATATVATLATHKAAQQVTVAEVAGVAVANALEPLITNPNLDLISHLQPQDETAIRAWLAHIEETDLEIIAHILNQCRTDKDAKDYFIWRASGL